MSNDIIKNTVDEITEKLEFKEKETITVERLTYKYRPKIFSKEELLFTGDGPYETMGLRACIDYAVKYPGAMICIIPAKKYYFRLIIETMELELNELGTVDYELRRRHDAEFHLENGSVITCRGVNYKGDLSRFRSMNADMIYLPHASMLTAQGFESTGITEDEFYEFYRSDLLLRLGRGPACQKQGAYPQIIIGERDMPEGSWIYRHFYEFEDCHGDSSLIKRMKENRGIYIVE